ncbi:hypothetical protein SAMN04487843_102231 [Methylobacterium sp. ap11]|uniref:hypothetical protein n=1 Tax=Methylobacterium sp. ap11 TaxID=1761799 RepID=UPI0008CD60D4|nr:hypothetical protein [Methylobacterium sp. ap11]SEO57866.1 hypothetical protein SAMN04487843_102231 [Methylobacterium sp. ap11]
MAILARAALPVLLVLAGCGDEPAREEVPPVVARRDTAGRSDWLGADDRTDPALWLAARAAGHPVPAADATVAALRAALSLARPHFIEDERMIANRTAQVARMVASVPDPETLVSGLTAVAAPTGRRQLYGALCQQYVNLRTAGADNRTALDRLRESYGAQGGPDPAERSTAGTEDPPPEVLRPSSPR